MKTQFLKLSIGILLSLFFIGHANAQPGNGRMFDSIPGITKDQKLKIATLQATQRVEMGELMDLRKKATTWDEKDKLDRQMLEKRIEHRTAVRNVLTDDQKKYFDQNFDKMFERGKGRFEGRRGPNHEKGMKHENGPEHE